MKIHIVQQGDTLWKLSKKYNVDFEQLKAVNSHLSNPDVIMPGMKIKIPTAGVPVKKEAIKEAPVQQAVPKEMPKPKEMPVPKKEIQVTPPKIKEEIKQPSVQQPIIQHPIHIHPVQVEPVTHQQLQQQMNMNLNIYKPMQPPPPAPPPPPKMPVMEAPKVEEPKEEEVAPVEQPMEPVYAMPQNCIPITGVIPGCSCNVPPQVQYYQGYNMTQGYPYGGYYPQPMMPPVYQQPPFYGPAPMPYAPPQQMPPYWNQEAVPQQFGDITGNQGQSAMQVPQPPWTTQCQVPWPQGPYSQQNRPLFDDED